MSVDGDGDGDVAARTMLADRWCQTDPLQGIMLSFQKLDVYKRAVEFFALTAEVSCEVPRGYATLLDQLRRAASSVLLNIAEAAGRSGKADAARTYAIARGSAMECAAILDTLVLLKVVDTATHEKGMRLLEGVVAMLTKLCLQDRAAKSPSPSPSTLTSTSTSTGSSE